MNDKKNLFSQTRTVIKLDYYGQPYEATVIGRELPDRGKLWAAWRFRQTWEASGNFDTKKQNTLKLIEDEHLND